MHRKDAHHAHENGAEHDLEDGEVAQQQGSNEEIVLPDAAREKPRQGRVLAVGDGRLLVDGSRA
ncbi:MAG: hypothetical protein Q8P98_07435, partial [Candidatus Rokubacteria bacterium]|nr:hypothetical protein [Candidatus Rokubacteria bacterium]